MATAAGVASTVSSSASCSASSSVAPSSATSSPAFTSITTKSDLLKTRLAFSASVGYGWQDYDIARDIALEWAAATQTLGGGEFHTIYAYDTLPKEQCWVYGNTGIITFIMEIEDHCWFSGADVAELMADLATGDLEVVI